LQPTAHYGSIGRIQSVRALVQTRVASLQIGRSVRAMFFLRGKSRDYHLAATSSAITTATASTDAVPSTTSKARKEVFCANRFCSKFEAHHSFGEGQRGHDSPWRTHSVDAEAQQLQ